jgi:hypothetical protein
MSIQVPVALQLRSGVPLYPATHVPACAVAKAGAAVYTALLAVVALQTYSVRPASPHV